MKCGDICSHNDAVFLQYYLSEIRDNCSFRRSFPKQALNKLEGLDARRGNVKDYYLDHSVLLV